jgi:hypothetical protein
MGAGPAERRREYRRTIHASAREKQSTGRKIAMRIVRRPPQRSPFLTTSTKFRGNAL